MSADTKMLIIRALNCLRGDDLYRAECAFKGMTPEQLQMKHGQSGSSRQWWLDAYRKKEDAINAAIVEVTAL